MQVHFVSYQKILAKVPLAKEHSNAEIKARNNMTLIRCKTNQRMNGLMSGLAKFFGQDTV